MFTDVGTADSVSCRTHTLVNPSAYWLDRKHWEEASDVTVAFPGPPKILQTVGLSLRKRIARSRKGPQSSPVQSPQLTDGKVRLSERQ